MDKSASGILIAPDQSEGEPGGWINKSPSPETQRVRVGSPERRMMEAMLLLCGERGYVEVTVAEVIARSGASRNTFYKHFSDKEECFFRAYEEGIEELAARVLEPARAADSWRAGVRAGLGALVDVLDEQPVIARCLLVEAYPAGRRAMDKRAEVLRRFGERARSGPGADGAARRSADARLGDSHRRDRVAAADAAAERRPADGDGAAAGARLLRRGPLPGRVGRGRGTRAGARAGERTSRAPRPSGAGAEPAPPAFADADER